MTTIIIIVPVYSIHKMCTNIAKKNECSYKCLQIVTTYGCRMCVSLTRLKSTLESHLLLSWRCREARTRLARLGLGFTLLRLEFRIEIGLRVAGFIEFRSLSAGQAS